MSQVKDSQTTAESASPAAIAAAQWWAEQVGAPVHILTPGGGHPDAEYGAVASFLMDEVTRRHPIREGQGDALVAALSVAIDQQLVAHGGATMGVDYGPDRTLAEAADVAGIHPSRFPLKTTLWAKPTHVTASLGYRGRDRLVWMAPDWERPACEQHQYDAEQYPLLLICPKPRYHEDQCGDWVADHFRCGECGGTYLNHFGRDSERSERDYHSWTPVTS